MHSTLLESVMNNKECVMFFANKIYKISSTDHISYSEAESGTVSKTLLSTEPLRGQMVACGE